MFWQPVHLDLLYGASQVHADSARFALNWPKNRGCANVLLFATLCRKDLVETHPGYNKFANALRYNIN